MQDKTMQAQTRQENTRPDKRLLLCFKRSKPARLNTLSDMHYCLLDVLILLCVLLFKSVPSVTVGKISGMY